MPTVLITGANRGIGLELSYQYLTLGFNVISTCRLVNNASQLQTLKQRFQNTLQILALDLLSEDSIKNFQKLIHNLPIDIFISNAGVYGPRNVSLGNITSKDWINVLTINTVSPLLLTQQILENIKLGQEKKIIFISSKVGSIKENTGGGVYAYRSSKTALNQVVKSLSIDLESDKIGAFSIHPGWVKTDMGGPNATIDTKTSVAGMIRVISNLTFKDTGSFFNYDGEVIAW